MRTMVYGGLYWGSPILGNCHLQLLKQWFMSDMPQELDVFAAIPPEACW